MAELGAFAKIKLDPSDCPVQFATVYEDRAEVSRLFVVKAEPRTVYEISLVGLTAAMEPSSVRVGGQMTILEVSSEMKAPSASAEDEAGAAEGDLSRQLEAEKRAQVEARAGSSPWRATALTPAFAALLVADGAEDCASGARARLAGLAG